MPLSPIITGASGMVGRAVLLECLDNPHVERVVMINRRPVDVHHPKLTEIIHADFSDIGPIREQLRGYDACFYCAGVSVVGKSEEEYTRLTYELVVSFARTLHDVNPNLVLNYVSGVGTDVNGRQMWARVKGRTEVKLLNVGFRDAYMFRLGMLLPERDLPMKTVWVAAMYRIFKPLAPLLRRFSWATTDKKLGRAMINVVLHPREEKIVESADINRLGTLT
ncbi:NAD-dependent epimerase/dehydratase family protein [Lewinella sp. JB7]|uniref:NAD-dependent epimerase/dehydratase family protein n=1 Tax=Lewinella sp. JB7 TaxID=2962887 RepID=UPI0020C9C714|nr:NAD-dependent epimerase/dehydratase family protein [Lewinella sp. JB7]MCP9234696.1 NAD-dependent epimerase/dehydratase family protein [Lewinella sp. JB7]